MDSLRHFGFLLKDVSRLYSRNFARHAEALGLTLSECRVLTYLSRNEGISQARLAYLTETDPMTLCRILKRMEDGGLVKRKPDPDDRRVLTLSLRPPAAQRLQDISRLSDQSIEESLAGLNAAERTGLMKMLRVIHANLDALLPGMADRGGVVRGVAQRRRHATAGTGKP